MIAKVILLFAATWMTAVISSAQEKAQLTPKTLYYQAESDEEKPKVVKPVVKHTPKPVSADQSATASPVVEKVEHLGLRYNLLMFNRETKKGTPVDTEHFFEQGDCVQVQLAPNRNGYLYIFNQGSSGKWQTLLPSASMSDEVNMVRGMQSIAVPANYCFKIESPSGTEHLFVVLSRSQEDIKHLNEAIHAKQPAAEVNMASKTDAANSMTEGANRLDREVEKMRAGLTGRDLGVEKIEQPDKPDEPADSVYVVNTSTVSSSRLVTEIQIRHH